MEKTEVVTRAGSLEQDRRRQEKRPNRAWRSREAHVLLELNVRQDVSSSFSFSWHWTSISIEGGRRGDRRL